MTYAQLMDQLTNITDEQLHQNVVVKIDDEYVPVVAVSGVAEIDTDILDPGHLVLVC